MVRVTRYHGARDLGDVRTFEDYLGMPMVPDIVQEVG